MILSLMTASTAPDCGFPWIILIGWIVSMILGIGAAVYMDRKRALHGIRSQVLIIADDLEQSDEWEDHDASAANSIETVWEKSLPEIRAAVFRAMPYLVFPGEHERLTDYWRSLKSLDIRDFYDRGSEELVDRVIFSEPTKTKKQGLTRALKRLEDYIR